MIVQLLVAFLGSVGFALMLKIKGRCCTRGLAD